jgi:crotonobetainyl-CoA:carnitine CoA-transferase CaiB-like acyl-CoA transferase
MRKIRFSCAVASAAAVLALAACNNEPETITGGVEDPQAEELAKATPKQLPPAIASSRVYRCKDNSLVYIDFMNDQKTAIFRADKGGSPTMLNAPEPGKPFVAEGYSLEGSGKSVQLQRPGKGSQACKA